MRKPMMLSGMERRLVEVYRRHLAEAGYDEARDWHQPSLVTVVLKTEGVKGNQALVRQGHVATSLTERGVSRQVDGWLDVVTVRAMEAMCRTVRLENGAAFREGATSPKGEDAQATFDALPGEVSHA